MQAQRSYVTTFKVLRLGFKPTSWIQNPVFIPGDMLLPLEQGRMWQILGEKLLEGRRDDSLAGGKGSWPRHVWEARKAYAGDKGVEETTWAEPHRGGGRWMCTPRDQWDSRMENRRAKSRSWQTASSESLNSTMWTMVSHCRFSERDIITAILWGHHSHNVQQGWRGWRLFKGRKVS